MWVIAFPTSTASDGPGPDTLEIDGRQRRFFDYLARGVPDGPDDGTIAPWAVVASLPFAPEIVLPTLDYFINHVDLKSEDRCGFKATFNPTHPDRSKNRSAGCRRGSSDSTKARSC